MKKMWLPRSSSTVDKHSSAPENQPPLMNSIGSAAEDHALPPGDEEDLQLALLKNEDVKNTSSTCDSHSSDDDNDSLTLPELRSCGTDDSDGDSERGNSDWDEEENTIPYSFKELWYDREKESPSSSTEKDFPPLSTIKSVIAPRPTELPASGKIHSQWEIPLLFCPHHSPTATFANGEATHAQAPVQGKAEAPQANSRNYAAAAPTQQEAYDLLADFPALQASKTPLALGVFHDGNPTTNDAEGKGGHTRSHTQCQESRAYHQRRTGNVSHEVHVRAGDHKYVLNIETFDHGVSSSISCEEPQANEQPPPRATDGVDANGRSWACAAKAGMKRAAAPQEIGRPYSLQQRDTINQVKGGEIDEKLVEEEGEEEERGVFGALIVSSAEDM
ncbi:hypothetical protein EYF80_001607 [Liparis tanakae]|uniref:Uncharacterized protein n=1 Tax=Liparis tanakae TaxID=230148 RepID=A0A4Z2JCS7_9TELE|nr:hypothetical protein EYF80_001607 [Liparis tanakae]